MWYCDQEWMRSERQKGCLLAYLTSNINDQLLSFLLQWLPESVRFYLTAGEREKAVHVLQECSRLNKKELPPGELKDVNAVS